MSKRRIRPNQSKIIRPGSAQPFQWRTLIAAVFLSGGVLTPGLIAWANGPAPGTVIQNQATGSFVDPTDSSVQQVESNIVQVTVAEVAGITVTSSGASEAPSGVSGAGPNQGNGSINAEDVVYYQFTLTNVGNDPTQFFIPGAPSDIQLNGSSGGGSLQGDIEIIAYDPDGASGATAPTDLSGSPVTVPSGGDTTGSLLSLPNGSIPPDGTVTIRVPIKLSATVSDSDTVTVVMGDTAAVGDQNQVYSDDGSNFDLYTHDNLDSDTVDIPATAATEQEAAGAPINGDATHHRQEASASQSTTVALPALDYGDAPDTYGTDITAGNSANSSDLVGASHAIATGIYLGATPPDTETDAALPLDGTSDGAEDDAIASFPSLDAAATTYSVTLPVSNDPDGLGNSVDPSANLVGWIDFDGDGVFQADEAAIATVLDGDTSATLIWNNIGSTGPDINAGSTYARFRLTTDAITGASATGFASDGEVEDYPVTIAAAPPASVTGAVWHDADANGVENSESPVQYAQVNLYDTNGTPGDTSDDTIIAFVFTDTAGAYSFTNIVAGDYYVDFVKPAVGYNFTSQDTGGDDQIDSDADATTGETDPFTLAAGEAKADVDAGLTLPENTVVACTIQSLQSTNWTLPLSIDKFAPTVGSLTSVDIKLNSVIDGQTLYENEDVSAITLTLNRTGSTITANLPNTDTVVNTYNDTQSQPVDGFDGGVDFSGSSGGTINFINVSSQTGSYPAANLDDFEAAAPGEQVNISVATAVSTAVSGGGNLTSFTTHEAGATLCATYSYATDPNVLLVKRITLLNGDFSTTNGNDLSAYFDDPASAYDDNTITISTAPVNPGDPVKDTDRWPNPNTFLVGSVDGGDVLPDDEMEYTIYFLSSGDATARNVLFCDRVPGFVDFLPAVFNVENASLTADPSGNPIGDRGIVLGLGTGASAISQFSLTNEADGDGGYYFPPGVNPTVTFPNLNCGGTNDNGAVVVNLGNLPNATSAGEPAGSYGFVRFRAKVR